MAPVFLMNLYHFTLASVASNTQVSVVDPPSHTVTSSGSLITVKIVYFCRWLYLHDRISVTESNE